LATAEKVLVCTFGFDESKVLRAMRGLAYNRLILIAGQDALSKESFRNLVELERRSNGKVETILVDVFDFLDCFNKVNTVLHDLGKRGASVYLNISGGTKVLADAALLAGFQNGVETYHCEEKITKLPVIKGFTIEDRFSKLEQLILRNLSDGDVLHELITQIGGVSEAGLNAAIRRLVKKGVLEMTLRGGKIYLYFVEGQEYLSRIFREKGASNSDK